MGNYRKHVAMLATTEGWRASFHILEAAGKLAQNDILYGLDHPNWRIRKWCAALMDHQADEGCIEALVRGLTDPFADVRRHAVHSIGCQSCKDNPLCLDIVPLLIDRALQDSSIRVRRSAVHMLGNQLFDNRAIIALEKIIERGQDSKIVSNAIWSLKQQRKSACDSVS